MMSRRCEYALRALVDLALARAAGRDRLAVQEIARHERLPERFLEQILIQLRREGILKSFRGRRGGYGLARSPGSIRLGAVVRLLEGPLAPIACASRSAYAACTCPDEERCGLRMVMVEARDALASILDRYSLAEVVRRVRGAHRKARAPLPFAGAEV